MQDDWNGFAVDIVTRADVIDAIISVIEAKGGQFPQRPSVHLSERGLRVVFAGM